MGHLHTPAMCRSFKLSQRVEYRQLSTAKTNRTRTKEVEHSKTSAAAAWVAYTRAECHFASAPRLTEGLKIQMGVLCVKMGFYVDIC